MPKAKTKKGVGKGRKKRARKSVIEASVLGIAPEQLLGRAADSVAVSVLEVAPSPQPLPTGQAGSPIKGGGVRRVHILHRPLVSGRTSFWLGVGFGIFVTGVLSYLAWRLYSVEIAEAIVLGLGV